MPWFAAMLMTALSYAVVGALALQLAIPPSYASPLYPSAGVALVAVLVRGWRMLPGVALGALIVNGSLAAQRGQFDLAAIGLPAVIALGAGLQAFVGAWLVRRFVRQPLTLGEPRDIAMFFGLGAAVACLVNSSLSTAALALTGSVPREAVPMSWLTWWAGDTLGVLVGAPIVLTLIGRPRSEWVPRRLTVGLTLLLATAFIAAGIAQVARWDEERARSAFERDADNATSAFRSQLQEPLHALEAIRGVFVASNDVTGEEIHRAARPWLESGNLMAIGWNQRVSRSELQEFEARVRANGPADFRVFDRPDASPPQEGFDADEVVAMRYIEPMKGNASALGVNVLSSPAARLAVQVASQTGLPSATAGFRLTQQDAQSNESGVVIYAAVYDGDPVTGLDRQRAMRGVVFVTLRVDSLLAGVQSQLPHDLTLCLIDTDPRAARRRLAGPVGCDSTRFESTTTGQVRSFAYAGRIWDLRVGTSTAATDAAWAGGRNAWLFSLVGLAAAAMLGALLLTVTGRARRIEAAVRMRTAALQAEMRDRERAQKLLQESEQRFRNILDNVPIGVIYTDLHGKVIKANPRLCELTGYSEERLLSMTTAQLTHPEDVAQDIELSGRLLRGEFSMYRCQKRCITSAGQAVWVQATVSLLRDAQGQPQHIVGAVEDISERLRLQEAEHARELAEASNRAKSDFLSRMSHELRTPLNAILGFAQLLELDRRQPLTAAQQPWVGQIQQAGWHLLEMINDVLDLSRIESGNLRLQSEPLNLNELISSALPMVEGEASRRHITINTRLDGYGCHALGDATRVRQIIINLLSNAVKYNVDGGVIDISSRMQGSDAVEVEVTDTGIGMTPDQLDGLFQPFNRLGREQAATQGTGIGLVISKSLAELMGGRLQAHSTADRGTTFLLTLPVGVTPQAVAIDTRTRPIEPAAYHERVVLYVEDNETNVEVMRGILAKRPQVHMAVSTHGKDALAAVRDQLPDLILLDMHLPDMTGIDLLRRLKSSPSTANIPVVAVSADAVAQHIQSALQAGAVRYLTKPVGVAELLAVVDEHLSTVVTTY